MARRSCDGAGLLGAFRAAAAALEAAVDEVNALNVFPVPDGDTGSNMIAAFGDERRALLMYDTETVPVKSAPGAECVTVEAGKIVHSRFLFDRLPFEEARRGN